MGRRARRLSIVVVASGALHGLGCSTSTPAAAPADSAPPLAACNDGTRQEGSACVVDEKDASVTSGLVFTRDVEPILDHYCGVVGCHVPGSSAGQLNLAPGFAYQSLVDATPGQTGVLFPNLRYVAPGDLDASYLSIKIHTDKFSDLKDAAPAASRNQLGSVMPAPQTKSAMGDADVDTIDNWIVEGAN